MRGGGAEKVPRRIPISLKMLAGLDLLANRPPLMEAGLGDVETVVLGDKLDDCDDNLEDAILSVDDDLDLDLDLDEDTLEHDDRGESDADIVLSQSESLDLTGVLLSGLVVTCPVFWIGVAAAAALAGGES